MFGGNRGYFAAAIFGLVAFSVVLGAVFSDLAQRGNRPARYPSYTETAKQLGGGAVLPVQVPVQSVEKKQPCVNPQGREDSDLCAQWNAANAAGDAADYSRWQTILAALGTLGVLISLFYTRQALLLAKEATNDSEAALAVAQRNADAATSQAESAKASVELANRPVLIFDGVVPDPPVGGGQTIPVRFAFRNIGKTPALSVSFAYARAKGNAVDLVDRVAALGVGMVEKPIEDMVAPDSVESFGKTGCHVGLLVESSFYQDKGGVVSETFDRVLVVIRIKYRSAFQALDSEYSTEAAISIQPEWANGHQTGRLQAFVLRGSNKIK